MPLQYGRRVSRRGGELESRGGEAAHDEDQLDERSALHVEWKV